MTQLSLISEPPRAASTVLRPFQVAACKNVWLALEIHRSVLLVAPTGSGKTVMGMALLARFRSEGHRVLVVAHRRELIQQTARKIRESSIGPDEVGIVMPGYPLEREKSVQVASIQTLLAQGFPPNIGLLLLDEAHHYPADDWQKVYGHYPLAKTLGLTATPCRSDGRALGDIFEHLIVAAKYSELIHDSYLVPCRVLQPPITLGSNQNAQDPLFAYQSLAGGTRAFGFADRVERCEILARRFAESGIPSAIIEANTPRNERDRILGDFRAGEIKVLWNVYTLTEGVDIPDVSTVILARNVDHVGAYLQMCGRALRPAPGKTEALLIDLVGASRVHGSPTENRVYSLTGTAIAREATESLRICLKCGNTATSWTSKCPVCGFEPPKLEPAEVKYLNLLLEELAGSDSSSPSQIKSLAYQRLREQARGRGWRPSVVVVRYRKLFGEPVTIDDATPDERREEYARLSQEATEAGFKPGWVYYRFKDTFGFAPQKGFDY